MGDRSAWGLDRWTRPSHLWPKTLSVRPFINNQNPELRWTKDCSHSRWRPAFAILSRTSLPLKVVHRPTDRTQVASRSAQKFHMVPVGKRQPQEEQEVNCSSIRDPRTTRVRKPRPWRIPRAIQEDWAKNSRKATKRGAPYSKRVYGVASPDAPKKARKIRYVRRPSINISTSIAIATRFLGQEPRSLFTPP